jgi:hypothetical protein
LIIVIVFGIGSPGGGVMSAIALQWQF